MKEDTGFTFLLISILCFVFILLGALLYLSNPAYNWECLESFAKRYCIENNMSLTKYYRDSFYCKEDVSQRFRREQEKIFYFVSPEQEACLIKEKWSFKREK